MIPNESVSGRHKNDNTLFFSQNIEIGIVIAAYIVKRNKLKEMALELILKKKLFVRTYSINPCKG